MDVSLATPAAAPPLANSYWVLPGRLLAGEHPCGLTPELTRARLAKLLEVGIDCFVDLTQPEETTAYRESLPAGVAYFSKPIPDHGLPAEQAHMRGILDCVLEALQAGRRVYLHCRAGIGRTGMVAGCLLAEQGGAEEPLTHLNRLWRQCARSAHWPEIPETLEQTEYVRGWIRSSEPDPLLEPGTLNAAGALRERFHGALLGLAAGDAVGVATQLARPGRFAPVGDMVGGGPFELPRGGWSDDTAMTLCLAESLLESEGFDARDQVSRYRRWQKHGHLSATGQCVGITAGTVRALAVAQWRRQSFSGTHNPQAQDPEPLSRVAAVVLYFFGQGEAVTREQAAEAARTTCQAPAVLEACRSLAAALHAALCGRGRHEVLARIDAGSAAAAQTVAAQTVEVAAGQSARTRQKAVPGGTARTALAAAADVFARTTNFRGAVLGAANLGGNSDVVSAVCGALAGAHYGAGAIPPAWRNSLMKKASIESFADRLLTHALLDLGG